MNVVRSYRDLLPQVVRAFLGGHPVNGPYVLAAIAELLEPESRALAPDTVSLDTLVSSAVLSRAAERKPRLDPRLVRKSSLILFQELETIRLGRLMLGRRGHPTRFQFSWNHDDGPEVFRRTLGELGVQQPTSSAYEKDFKTRTEPPASIAAAGDSLRRDDVVARLKGKAGHIHRLGVTNLSLFGSVARDEARPDSDVDLLATFETPVTSDAFFGAKFFLEDLLGKRIDLLTDSALSDRVRHGIEPELIRVA